MSIDDLVIKKHTAPLRAEIDRLREVKAKLKEQNKALVAALDDAMQAAFDGPREPKGTGLESSHAWRRRIEASCRAALAAARGES